MTMGRQQVRAVMLTASKPWAEAALAAATSAGGIVIHAASAAQALRELVTQGPPCTHLLLDPRDAATLLDDLIGMTTGEGGSAISLVQLGATQAAPPHARVVARPSAAALRQALSAAQPAESILPAIALDELITAIGRGMMRAHYQPIVRVADGRAIGAEVLARLEHPRRGLLTPEHFVPLLEAAGLAGQLTAAVVAHALRDIARAGLSGIDFTLALNFPLDVILMPDIMARMAVQCAASGVTPRQIMIELTESRPVHDLLALGAALDQLRRAGYGLAIDDIGPGITWHTGLLDLPFTAIKLDIGVVQGSAGDTASADFLDRTIAAAQRRGLSVIAEGIEDTQTWHRMRAIGVDHVQGFLVSHPLPAAALPMWIEHWKKKHASLGLKPP